MALLGVGRGGIEDGLVLCLVLFGDSDLHPLQWAGISIALFLEWGGRVEDRLVLHHRTMPGPLWKASSVTGGRSHRSILGVQRSSLDSLT